jgi:hypothetical protein
MDRPVVGVVFALALVLAGCGALPAGGGGEATPAETLTPAPVPTAASTPTPVPRLAPGLTAAGVVDPDALGRAHDAALGRASFTRHTTATVRYADGSLRNRYRVVTRVEPGGRFSSVFTVGRPGPRQPDAGEMVRTERWSDGVRVLTAATTANGTTTYAEVPRDRRRVVTRLATDTGGDSLARLLDGAETRVAGREVRDGTTLYRVVGTDLDPRGLPSVPRLERPTNASVRALIDGEGVVRERRVRFVATTENGSSVGVAVRVRYADLGATTVERPPWYGAAVENGAERERTTAGSSPAAEDRPTATRSTDDTATRSIDDTATRSADGPEGDGGSDADENGTTGNG